MWDGEVLAACRTCHLAPVAQGHVGGPTEDEWAVIYVSFDGLGGKGRC